MLPRITLRSMPCGRCARLLIREEARFSLHEELRQSPFGAPSHIFSRTRVTLPSDMRASLGSERVQTRQNHSRVQKDVTTSSELGNSTRFDIWSRRFVSRSGRQTKGLGNPSFSCTDQAGCQRSQVTTNRQPWRGGRMIGRTTICVDSVSWAGVPDSDTLSGVLALEWLRQGCV